MRSVLRVMCVIAIAGAIPAAAQPAATAEDVTVVDARDAKIVRDAAPNAMQNWWREGTTWGQALLQCAAWHKHLRQSGTAEERNTATQTFLLAGLNRLAKDRHLDRSALFPSLRSSIDVVYKDRAYALNLALIDRSVLYCDALLKANNAAP